MSSKSVINMLVTIAAVRDYDTGSHVRRVQQYVKALTDQLAWNRRYARTVTTVWAEQLAQVTPLHDVGKVGIPDSILLKPWRLTPEETTVMQQHCMIGYEIILEAEREFPWLPEPLREEGDPAEEPSRLRQTGEGCMWELAKEVVLAHHERWDGGGYPRGLRGNEIPLSARIVALADVFDALTSVRIYRDPMPLQEAARYVALCSGSHFDPEIVAAFIRAFPRFEQIASSSPSAQESLPCGKGTSATANSASLDQSTRQLPLAQPYSSPTEVHATL